MSIIESIQLLYDSQIQCTSTLLRSNFAWVEAALQSGHGCVTFRRQEVAKIQTKTPYGLLRSQFH